MSTPISLHPANPHHFLYKNRPLLLVASAEHYGAVLNGGFDFKAYLGELKECGNNLTRAFAGLYREAPGAFYDAFNTLAPLPADFLCPYPRSTVPGSNDGLNKFDLDAWDERYFSRLSAFMEEAAAQEIIVEFTFFCNFYLGTLGDLTWNISPYHAQNNINGVGDAGCEAIFRWEDPTYQAYQTALVRKLVEFLNPYDNLMFEIMNEPYIFNAVNAAFEKAIAAIVVETEQSLPKRHLITQNIANHGLKIVDPNPLVSVFNFHYATPPHTVGENYALDRPIGNNETGFAGNNLDATFRKQAWEFLHAGGALFNNLDFSFAVGNERGSDMSQCEHTGGSHALRVQLGFLRRFLEELDFVHLRPANELIAASGEGSPAGYLLAEPGKQYTYYLSGETLPAEVRLMIESGKYRCELFDPGQCTLIDRDTFTHPGGVWGCPLEKAAQTEIAIRVIRI